MKEIKQDFTFSTAQVSLYCMLVQKFVPHAWWMQKKMYIELHFNSVKISWIKANLSNIKMFYIYVLNNASLVYILEIILKLI